MAARQDADRARRNREPSQRLGEPPLRITTQVSAGGVAYRGEGDATEVALISVGAPPRWQLPKGTVEAGETAHQAAVREVREETGLTAALEQRLETIQYWYQGWSGGSRVRYHKYVHFFLLRYVAGDVSGHDGEVHEARWFPLGEALGRLAFPNERRVVERAREIIAAGSAGPPP
jgi:8-oxo-dGTP pyrophosphatase MutT (NUDIX family)